MTLDAMHSNIEASILSKDAVRKRPIISKTIVLNKDVRAQTRVREKTHWYTQKKETRKKAIFD